MLRLIVTCLFVSTLSFVAACERETKDSCSFEGADYAVGATVTRGCSTCTCRDDGTLYCDGRQCAADASVTDAAGDSAADDASAEDASADDAAADDATTDAAEDTDAGDAG